MDTRLNNRVALITGSSSGLGKAIAKALAAEGASVIINGRYNKKLKNAALEIARECGPNTIVHRLVCDATQKRQVTSAVNEKLTEIGQLDILVNNVGNIEKFGIFENLSEEDWQRSFDLTFMSTVRFTKASLPYLRRSNQARVINILAISARQPGNFNPHYSAVKAGLLNLTKYLANHLGTDRILVNAICPSTLTGGGWHHNIKDRAEREEMTAKQAEKIMRLEESKKSPLGTIGELKDVANLVVFLSSSRAKFLTGHCYNVDGGITRSTT